MKHRDTTRVYTSSRKWRPGDVECPLYRTLFIPAFKPACQRGTGATCGECAAHHAPQGTQGLLPLDEGHGVERRPRDVSADPLPW